jgi:hypothetical protein
VIRLMASQQARPRKIARVLKVLIAEDEPMTWPIWADMSEMLLERVLRLRGAF